MSGHIGDFIIDVKGRTVKPGDIFWIDSPIFGHRRVKVIESLGEGSAIAIEFKSHIPEIELNNIKKYRAKPIPGQTFGIGDTIFALLDNLAIIGKVIEIDYINDEVILVNVYPQYKRYGENQNE